MTENEAKTVQRAKAGDAAAFEALVRTYQGRVRAYFATRVRDSAQVDDLAQDTFLIAYQRLDTFRESMPFYPWLKGIALNILRNERRKMRASVVDGEDELAVLLDRHAVEESDRLDELVSDRDLIELLRHCIGKLKDVSARILNSYYVSGQALAEIGTQEGKSQKAIAVSLVRIRRQLRTCLTRQFDKSELADMGMA